MRHGLTIAADRDRVTTPVAGRLRLNLRIRSTSRVPDVVGVVA
jgi:hypothetical protein